MLDQEILTGTRTALKQIVPPLALRHDHTAAADLQNVDLMHVRRKSDRLGQTDRWLRLLVNTVELVMASSFCISKWDIHSLEMGSLQGLKYLLHEADVHGMFLAPFRYWPVLTPRGLS